MSDLQDGRSCLTANEMPGFRPQEAFHDFSILSWFFSINSLDPQQQLLASFVHEAVQFLDYFFKSDVKCCKKAGMMSNEVRRLIEAIIHNKKVSKSYELILSHGISEFTKIYLSGS